MFNTSRMIMVASIGGAATDQIGSSGSLTNLIIGLIHWALNTGALLACGIGIYKAVRYMGAHAGGSKDPKGGAVSFDATGWFTHSKGVLQHLTDHGVMAILFEMGNVIMGTVMSVFTSMSEGAGVI